MLGQLLTTGIARFLAAAAAGANDTQADVAFVTKAVTTVRNEVAASTVAVKESASGAVKNVATSIGTDQRSLSEQLLAIARAKGVSVPPGDASPTDAPGYSDHEFVVREIKSHREAIALYEDEASSSDAQLRAFAQQILPQLHQHLAMLESLKLPPRDPGRHRDGPPGRRS
jgi:putative membrane protein